MPVSPVVLLVASGFWLAGVALISTAAYGLKKHGPTRWVKVVAFLAMLCVLGMVSPFLGPALTAALAGFFVVFPVSTGAILTLSNWRAPFEQVFEDVTADACPEYARGTLEGWASEIRALGFAATRDTRWRWRYSSEDRESFVRFFQHPDLRAWFQTSALGKPRGVSRIVITSFADGSALLTSDTVLDPEMFSDPLTVVHHVSRTESSERMLAEHMDAVSALRKQGREALRVEDAARENVARRRAWLDRLLASGQLVRECEWVRIPLRMMPRMAATVLRHFFQ